MLTAAMATWDETPNGEMRSERLSSEGARWLLTLLARHDVVARIERAAWGRRSDRVVLAARADIERVHAAEHAAWEVEQARIVATQAWRQVSNQPIEVEW